MPYYKPPAELATDFGDYRSPLKFDDGTPVRTAKDWEKRRGEILKYWHTAMGDWPPLIEKPRLEPGAKDRREGITQYPITIETAPGRLVDDAYLLIPDGKGPFPAVVVVFYEAKTGVGLGSSTSSTCQEVWCRKLTGACIARTLWWSVEQRRNAPAPATRSESRKFDAVEEEPLGGGDVGAAEHNVVSPAAPPTCAAPRVPGRLRARSGPARCTGWPGRSAGSPAG